MDPIRYQTPDELKALVSNEYKELKSFLTRIRKKPPKNLDEWFFQLHQEAFDQFDCLDCANCCKTISPIISDKDIDRLAKANRMRPVEFVSRYLQQDEDQDFVFTQAPCPFLMPDRYCSVYENRPKACREYPHTDRRRMVQILNLTLKNCEICPVVYTIVTHLRKEYSAS